MSFWALALIVISAFMHAAWNYLAKQSGGGNAFVWLYMVVSLIVYAPFVIGFIFWRNIQIGWLEIGLMGGSALIHLMYSLLLQKGYKIGDLSLIYPICRGTGPLITAVAAIFIYGERLSLAGFIGILLITLGIFGITGGLQTVKQTSTLIPVSYGLLIGVMIASYTLLDKGAVSIVMMEPLVLIFGSTIFQALILTPFVVRDWKRVQSQWYQHKKEAIGVGILNQLAYVLVLIALTFTPVSHVAPVREVSILIGTALGSFLLKEGFGVRRIVASCTMVVGVMTVALQQT